MSEPQTSTTESKSTTEPTKSAAPKPKKSKPLPDWKPLGTIRDYFTEQMKQDQFR
ncbi:MAG: hypothetical protein K0Q50_915 [Vampirovibrio sp.]|nr:hypothetical protein [Vampirovibrio sp.]